MDNDKKSAALSDEQLGQVAGGVVSNGSGDAIPLETASGCLCVRCRKNMGVIYVSREANGKPVTEAYCMPCAKEKLLID